GAGITSVTDNPKALFVITMTEAFKLCGHLGVPINIRRDAGLINKLEIIQDLRSASAASYAVFGTEIIVAPDTELVVTPINCHLATIPTLFYAVLSTFWLQNPTNPRAGLATGSYLIRQLGTGLSEGERPAVGDLASALDSELRKDQF